LKREGVVPGIPDLFIAYTTEGKHGLFIEMKAATGRLSEAQKNKRVQLMDAGYDCAVCRSFDEFERAVKDYLVIP